MINRSILPAAALTAAALLSLAGCATAAAARPVTDAPAPPEPAATAGPGGAGGTQPSGTPDDPDRSPEEQDAVSAAGTLAASSREWLTAWDDAGCSGERAAEDDRTCQVMLMDLADGSAGAAELLERQSAVLPELAEAADAARAAADAASDWLGAWCGGYADPACAEPGTALVDAARELDVALDAWLPRSTPDA